MAATAKKAAAPKKTASTASHGSYQQMISMAITQLKERSGSSRQAIKKYVLANNDLGAVSDAVFNSRINRALQAGSESGHFDRPKGPSGPVKLAKPEAKKAPAADKKPAAAAAAKKAAPSAKKETKPKAEKANTKKARTPKSETTKTAKPKDAKAAKTATKSKTSKASIKSADKPKKASPAKKAAAKPKTTKAKTAKA